MNIDVRTGLFGFILGGLSGLGIGQVIDSDLKLLESLAQLGSFLGGVGTILAFAIAFLVYKRWYRQHDFPASREILLDLKLHLEKSYSVISFEYSQRAMVKNGDKKADEISRNAYSDLLEHVKLYSQIYSRLKSTVPKTVPVEKLASASVVPLVGEVVDSDSNSLIQKLKKVKAAQKEVNTLLAELRSYF